MATHKVTGAMCFQGQKMHLYTKQSRQTGHPLQYTLTQTHTEITNYISMNLLKPMKLFMFTTSDHLTSGALSKEKGFSFSPPKNNKDNKVKGTDSNLDNETYDSAL